MRTQGGGSNSGYVSNLGVGIQLISKQMREFISSEITYGILDQTPAICGSVKEGIQEILDECVGALCAEVMAIIGARSPSFPKFWACGAPAFQGERDPIASRKWLADMYNASRTSFCPKEAQVRYVCCLLKDRTQDWWGEVGREVGDDVVEAMLWDDFSIGFRAEFAPMIEVQQLEQEFEDLCQTTETMAEITTKFRERALLVPQYAADE